MRSRSFTGALCAGCIIGFATVAPAKPALERDATTADPLATMEAGQMALFEKAGPAVAFLSHDGSFGSGFFVSADGLILTSAHVVGTERTLQIVLATGERRAGQVLKRAAGGIDLALVKIERGTGSYPWLRLHPGNNLRVGSWVASVGHGRGGVWAFNTGMVSNIYPYGNSRPVFQTQIPLNPGSSGGPIFDRRGRVVGIVTAGIKDSNSINFAIRSGVALQSFPELADACDCMSLAAPAGVPIFVDGRAVGVGPRVFIAVEPGTHEVFAVIGGAMRKMRVDYPAQRRAVLR